MPNRVRDNWKSKCGLCQNPNFRLFFWLVRLPRFVGKLMPANYCLKLCNFCEPCVLLHPSKHTHVVGEMSECFQFDFKERMCVILQLVWETLEREKPDHQSKVSTVTLPVDSCQMMSSWDFTPRSVAADLHRKRFEELKIQFHENAKFLLILHLATSSQWRSGKEIW